MTREAERPDDGRKTVLIVEDDPGTQRVLASGLATSLGMFDVLTANHGQEAVELIESRPVDVVVTDLAMPVMDGFALIGYLTNRGTTPPVVVLSALASTTVAEGLDGYGGLTVLRKPAGYPEVARAVLEALERHELGQVAGIPLASVLQLVEAERRTCSLGVTSGRRRGRLHFESGRLINAFSDDFGAEGEAAAFDILTWERTAIAFERLPEGVRRTIEMPTQMMLIEVAQRQDAQRAREAALAPPLSNGSTAQAGGHAPALGADAAKENAASDSDAPPTMELATKTPGDTPGEAPDATADEFDRDLDVSDMPDLFDAPKPAAPWQESDSAAVALRGAGPVPAEPDPVFEDDVPTFTGASSAPLSATFDPRSAAPQPAPNPTKSTAEPSAAPGAAPHAELIAAIERLTRRVEAADTALAAVADEVDAFRAAQQRYDEAVRQQDERRHAVEAAHRDVADLARQILARMDGLFDVFGTNAEAATSSPNP